MLTDESRQEIVRRMPTQMRQPIQYVLEQIAEELHEIKTDIALITEQLVEGAIEEGAEETEE